MNSKRYFLIAGFIVMVSGCLRLIANGQTAEEEAFAITIKLIQSAVKERKVALFERYAVAVERHQIEFQKKGQLENTLEARAEAKAARETLVVGEKDFPGVAKLREILAEELSKIEAAEEVQINQSRRKYLVVLKKRIQELTKERKLDDAIRLDSERKSLEAKLAVGEPNEPNPGTTPAPPAEPSGKLKQGEVLFGELTLSGGIHRLHKELQIGKRIKNTDNEKGFLTIKDHAQLSGASIWTNFGTLVANDSRFEDILIQEELQGRFTANRCLFEDCTFNKKGGWMVAWFGTKWEFDECVFQGSFFTQWANSKVGVKITNCTFIGVDFPSFQMKNDVVWESQHEWRTIKKCRFIQCEIPISVLLSIEDSVFEECRFVEDDYPETAAVLSAPSESIRKTIYFTGLKEPEITSPSSKLRFNLKSAPSSMGKRGCPPFYEIKANELRFR